MATKIPSAMTDDELGIAIRACLKRAENGITYWARDAALILANQYDAELTRRREGKTI